MLKRAVLRPVPAPRGSPRLVWLAYGSLALAVLAVTVPFPAAVADTFLQLRLGQYILDHGIPAVDPFSYTTPPQAYIDHEWLSCVVFALVYRAGGVAGLVALKVLLVSGTVLLAVQTARSLGAQLGVIALAGAPLVYLVAARVVERPHLFTSLGLALYAYLFVRVRGGQLSPRVLWLIPLLHAVWLNLHGGWPQGVALVGCWALGETVHGVRARALGAGTAPPVSRGRVVQLLSLLPLCAATSFVNPYGLELLLFPFHHAGLSLVVAVNTEWMALHRGEYHSPAFGVYLLFLAVLWWAWIGRRPGHPASKALKRDINKKDITLECQEGRGTSRGLLCALAVILLGLVVCSLQPPAALPEFRARILRGELPADVSGSQQALLGGLAALLGLWLLYAGRTWRTIDVTLTAMVLLFVALSLRYARAMPDAALGIFPVLTATVSARLSRRVRHRQIVDVYSLRLGVGLLLGLTGYLLLWGYPHAWHGRSTHRALGVGLQTRGQPRCAVDFLAREAVTGHALVERNGAPYVLWRLWPAVKTDLDTRDYLHPEPHFLMWYAATADPAALETYLQQWPPDVLLLRHANLSLEVYQWLVHTAKWTYIYMDDHYFVMVPPQGALPPRLHALAYEHILPWMNLPVTVANAPAVLAEAQRALAACPEGARFAWAYQAEALRLLGRHEDSLAARRQIPPQLWIE